MPRLTRFGWTLALVSWVLLYAAVRLILWVIR